MEISNILISLIKKYEGLSLYPYACPADKLTIGYGHVIQNNDIILGVNGKLFNNIFNALHKIFNNRMLLNQHLRTIFHKPLSMVHADKLLNTDIQKFCHHVNPLIQVPLNQNQYAAIISLTYNIGVSAFKKSTLLRFLNECKPQQAAQQFDRWIYANGQQLKGLIARRHAEKTLFLQPLSETNILP